MLDFLPKVVANVVSEEEKLTTVIGCLLVAGIGQIFGSIIIGKIIDIMGDKFTIFSLMGAMIISCLIMLLAHLLEEFTYLWYASSFLLGFLLTWLNTYNGAIVGSEFENQSEAFGWMNFSQSYIVFIILIVESLIKSPDQLFEQRIFIILWGIFGVVSCFVALTFPFKPKISPKSISNEEEIEFIDKLK